jgi:hypothetical protein
MSDEKRKPVHPVRLTESEGDVRGHPARSAESEKDVWGHPETNFLPPLKMFLAFSDRDSRADEKEGERQEGSDEKNIERLIEKLSEKDE